MMGQVAIERQSINLANVLISSEKLAYEQNGKIYRGILDAEKLKIFTKNGEPTEVDIGIGYPNSLNVVLVMDMETCNPPCFVQGGDCKNSICDTWSAILKGPILIEGFSTIKFISCIGENIKLGRAIFVWYPQDWEKCVRNSLPSSLNLIFTRGAALSYGLPILIRYPNGDLHLGRIFVGVVSV
jgi:hypothetical protein